MIRALAQDAPRIAAFLNQHRDTSMFALTNLAQHGMDNAHPRSLRCWLHQIGGDITAVLSITTEGMAMPQCPTFGVDDWVQAAQGTAGIPLIGIIGPATQARAFAGAAGLAYARASLNRDEPFMALDLADLVVTAQCCAGAPRGHSALPGVCCPR